MKGFSLVEALVSVVIFSLVFIAVFSFMNQGLYSWHIADVNIEVQQEARRALMALDRHLRQTRTSQISIPADDNYYTSITFKIPEDTDADGDVIDSSGNIEWSGNIVYSLNANKQLIRTDSWGTSVLANNIVNLQFKRSSGNPRMVEVYITTQKTTVPDKTSQVSIRSLFKVRN